MTLKVSHGIWNDPYELFARWRNEIAKGAGFEIHEGEVGPTYSLPWEYLTEANVRGEWDAELPIGIDPIVYLLCHSDCEGVIHPEQGTVIAKRLKQLLPKVGYGMPIEDFYVLWQRTWYFIQGLEQAFEAGETVVFA